MPSLPIATQSGVGLLTWTPCQTGHGMQETIKETLVSLRSRGPSEKKPVHSVPQRAHQVCLLHTSGQAHGSDPELFLSLLPPSLCTIRLTVLKPS